MGGGNQNQSSNVYEYEKDDDNSVKSDFVDAREIPEGKIPSNKSSSSHQFVLLTSDFSHLVLLPLHISEE